MRIATMIPVLALALLAGGGAAHAQTGTATDATGAGTSGATAPGAPNTGAGGNALVLIGTGAVALAGVYLLRSRPL